MTALRQGGSGVGKERGQEILAVRCKVGGLVCQSILVDSKADLVLGNGSVCTLIQTFGQKSIKKRPAFVRSVTPLSAKVGGLNFFH